MLGNLLEVISVIVLFLVHPKDAWNSSKRQVKTNKPTNKKALFLGACLDM
jgi:hypothetical protein